MRIQLTLRGGIYGVLKLEPVDTDDPGVALPEELPDLLSKPSAEGDHTPAANGIRTEGQTYELEVRYDDGSSASFSYAESAVRADPRLKELIDAIWSQTRSQGE